MSGTEWTEPGQGATLGELFDACEHWLPRKGHALDATEPDVQQQLRTRAALDGVTDWTQCTNLRLTGEPLTAEDLERIGRAR